MCVELVDNVILCDQHSNFGCAAIPIVFILFQNLASFLPSSSRDLNNNTLGVSVVISSQVGERGYAEPSQTLKDSPLSLNFSFSIENVSYTLSVIINS